MLFFLEKTVKNFDNMLNKKDILKIINLYMQYNAMQWVEI